MLATVAAAADALRPPRHFNYRESPASRVYYGRGARSSSRPSYLNSYSRHESFGDAEMPDFGNETPFNFNREGESLLYDSTMPSTSYFPAHKAHRSFYQQKRPTNFATSRTFFEEYRGQLKDAPAGPIKVLLTPDITNPPIAISYYFFFQSLRLITLQRKKSFPFCSALT